MSILGSTVPVSLYIIMLCMVSLTIDTCMGLRLATPLQVECRCPP